MDQAPGRQLHALDAIIIPNRVPNVKNFFLGSEFFTHARIGWSHLSFCQRERASCPASFFMGSLYPGLNLMSRTFFELVEFFSTLGARDLMRSSKGRTARSYFPTVHELIIAQLGWLVKKKVCSISFFFWHGFFRIRMYPNYFIIFLLTFSMRHGKIDHLLACTARKFPGKSS